MKSNSITKPKVSPVSKLAKRLSRRLIKEADKMSHECLITLVTDFHISYENGIKGDIPDYIEYYGEDTYQSDTIKIIDSLLAYILTRDGNSYEKDIDDAFNSFEAVCESIGLFGLNLAHTRNRVHEPELHRYYRELAKRVAFTIQQDIEEEFNSCSYTCPNLRLLNIDLDEGIAREEAMYLKFNKKVYRKLNRMNFKFNANDKVYRPLKRMNHWSIALAIYNSYFEAQNASKKEIEELLSEHTDDEIELNKELVQKFSKEVEELVLADLLYQTGNDHNYMESVKSNLEETLGDYSAGKFVWHSDWPTFLFDYYIKSFARK
jgi:hypothetical protein